MCWFCVNNLQNRAIDKIQIRWCFLLQQNADSIELISKYFSVSMRIWSVHKLTIRMSTINLSLSLWLLVNVSLFWFFRKFEGFFVGGSEKWTPVRVNRLYASSDCCIQLQIDTEYITNIYVDVKPRWKWNRTAIRLCYMK